MTELADPADLPRLEDRTRAVVVQLGDLLRDSGFEQAAVNALLRTPADSVPRRRPRTLPLQRLRIDHADPLQALVDLFVLGSVVPTAAVEAALPGADLAALAEAGVLTAAAPTGADAAWRAACSIVPFEGLLLAGDFHVDGDHAIAQVPAITPSSQTVLHAAPRGPTGTVLDIGAGSGLLGLAASAAGSGLVATDVNPRALAYVARNAALNRRDDVETRLGSLFDPVAGMRFDRIVCNPPYIIAPHVASMYEHAGLPGDEVSSTLVRTAAEHLEPDGLATFLCNWAHPEGDWLAPVRGWVADAGCDVLVVFLNSLDAIGYIEALQPGGEGEEAEAAIATWLTYFARLGIEHVAGGLVCLRRRADGGVGWVRHLEVNAPTAPHLGELLARSFAAADLLDGLDGPVAVLDLALRRVGGCRVDQVLADVDGQAVVTAKLGWPAAGAVTVATDLLGLVLWDALDGATPLGAVAAHVAEQGGIDLADVVMRCVELAPQLLIAGLVEIGTRAAAAAAPAPSSLACEPEPEDG